MANYMDKVGVVLTAEGVGSFTSAIKQGENALRQLQAEARRNIASLGSGAKAYDIYKAKMSGLTTQMKQSASNVNSLKSKYDALKKSTSEIPKEIEKLSNAFRQKQSVLKTNGTLLQSQKEHLKHLESTYGKSSTAVQKYKETVSNTSKAYKKTEQEVKSLETQIKGLNSTLSTQQKELGALPTKIANAETSYFKLRDAVEKTHAAFRNSGGRLADTAQRFNDVGTRAQVLGQKMSGVGDGLTRATAGISSGMLLAARSAINFESDFAGVVKTVNATPEQLDKIRQSFLNLSTEIPVSANELARIGEVAGQLGIKTENIVDFTKTIADLGATTNLSSEEGATSLAQFMAVMGTSQSSIRNLGSTLVELGNNFATNEKSIVEMSQRLSGMGKQTNMSEADVLGLAAAMSTVGIEAEAGGSAMTQVMTKMQNAVMSGGENLGKFAKAAGVSAGEFANAFNNRPVEALGLVLKGLKNVKESGGNVNDVLASLGVTGIREADAMKRLSGALDGDSGLGKALEIANKGWKENTALTKEASIRYQTSASKIQMAKNEIQKIAIEMGAQLLPRLAEVLQHSKPLVKTLGDMMLWFSKLPPAVQLAVLGMGPFLSVLGRLTSGIGAGVKSIGTLIQWLGKIRTGKAVADVAKLGTEIAGVGTKAATTGSMASMLTNPYVAGAALIGAAFVGLGYGIYREMTKDSRNYEASVEQTNGKYKEWYDQVIKGATQSGSAIDRLKGNVQSNTKAIVEEAEKIKKANTSIIESIDRNFKKGSWYSSDGELRKKLKENLSLSDEDVNEIEAKFRNYGIMLGNSLSSIQSSYLQNKTITADYAMAQIKTVNDLTLSTIEGIEKRRKAEMDRLEALKAQGLIEEAEYKKQAEFIKQTFDTQINSAKEAQGRIKEILSNAAKDHRSLTTQEMNEIENLYKRLGKSAVEAATSSKEAQELLKKGMEETALAAKIAALKQIGLITDTKEEYINNLGSIEAKVKEVNEILNNWTSHSDIKSIGIKFEGHDLVFNFKNDYERLMALPDIMKAITIAESQGRTIKMTKEDLEWLDKKGIKPKNVEIVDKASLPLDNINGKIDTFKNASLPPKSIMLRDEGSTSIDNVFKKVLDYNAQAVNEKNLKVNDNASQPITDAQGKLDLFNGTNPVNKNLSASGNASPFTQDATNSLNVFAATNPGTKSIMAQGNATPFTDAATASTERFNATPTPTKRLEANDNITNKANSASGAIRSIPQFWQSVISVVASGPIAMLQKLGLFASGGKIDLYTHGGNIDMFANGGMIGATQSLPPRYQGIVGEAGPELFQVTRSGVNITPLSTKEKIKGISGTLAEQYGANDPNVNITINVTGNNINNKEDIDTLVKEIEQKLVRSMKEYKNMSFGGGRNVVTL